jgi:transposase
MEQKIYIGIDLHKRTQTWVILGERDNTKLLTKTYPVTPEAIDTAHNQARKLGNKLIAFIEPVCGWIWVVKQLKFLGIEVHISNPRKVRMIADSLKKTDEEDAYILAKLLKTGNAYESYECDPKTRKHRSLSRERCFLVNTRASLKTRLESIVTRDGNHAFSPSLKNRTKISLANDEVKIHLKAIQAMDSIIKRVESQIADNMEYKKEEIERLLTIPGIGRVSANIIVSEIGDFDRFKKPQHLTSFAGLVPRERSSGSKQKLGSITHAGSPYLRYVLIESAMRIRDTKETQSLYSFYKNIKNRSGSMKARIALARKLLTIIWFMMKNRQNYVAY